jgi:magnesium transporter
VKRKRPGLMPGSPEFVGTKKLKDAIISVLDFDKAGYTEGAPKRIDELLSYKHSHSVTWINIDGLHDTELVSKLGEHFGIHPLVIEDIMNTQQRPKVELFDDYIFIVLKMLRNEARKVVSEQVSLLVGKGFIISFQESPGDLFDPLRERIQLAKGRVRGMGADYLAYCLIDIIIDYYFVILEKFGETIEEFEETLINNPKPNTLQDIYSLKREVLLLRKLVWPLREAINRLEKGETHLISKKTRPYLRDLYDHTIQIIDTVETSRDLLSGMLDLYLSSLSNMMNEVMKVLTIIATIFIPLTFIAGVYGMNFEFMPELGLSWAYFAVLGLMAFIAVLMVAYFRRKRWL